MPADGGAWEWRLSGEPRSSAQLGERGTELTPERGWGAWG
ncbi:MAG: hypothetical protein BWY63_03755 [Chloroflexi bacterium ADurb.Bin360]|nr:MAG: hypothetical protein BWY63_03755 [Chloroflexi bacterium ADurb.Bin360]